MLFRYQTASADIQGGMLETQSQNPNSSVTDIQSLNHQNTWPVLRHINAKLPGLIFQTTCTCRALSWDIWRYHMHPQWNFFYSSAQSICSMKLEQSWISNVLLLHTTFGAPKTTATGDFLKLFFFSLFFR